MEDRYLDKYDELLKLVSEEIEIDGKKYLLKEEFEKFFIKSNKSAGVRVRKIMQMIRGVTKSVRVDVQEYKDGID